LREAHPVEEPCAESQIEKVRINTRNSTRGSKPTKRREVNPLTPKKKCKTNTLLERVESQSSNGFSFQLKLWSVKTLGQIGIYDAVDRTYDLWAISQGVARHELTRVTAGPPRLAIKREWCCL
jgi:hypothetical protein